MRITPVQQAILDAIDAYRRAHPYAPTVRELAAAVGHKSSSTTHGHLQRMKARGGG